MHVSAIIAAGGRGRRLGADVPKQALALGGRPMLQWSVDALLASGRVDEIVVAVPPDWANAPPAYLLRRGVRVVAGGERRQDSVANGFDAVSSASDVVLIHDAARPFVSAAMIAGAIDAAAECGAAIVAVAARDTIKWSPPPTTEADAGLGRLIARTLARESIYLAQTPQAFRRLVLQEAVALGRQGVEVTDEAALAEQAGHAVRLVEGSTRNMKVTTAEDLVIAEALLNAESNPSRREAASAPTLRVGSGYDLHRFAEGRPLIIGGVTVPFDRGLAGHSDADPLCHAVTDAVLGAAAAGDIGQYFPDTDPRWRGASSVDMLKQAVEIARGAGYRIVNVDATIIAEQPKIAPYRAAIAASLAAAVGLPVSSVSVKAKTNEGVDATGRGEAIAVHAVALLELRAAGSGQPAAVSD
jgi:2-C-methyl-D-erythritol 4-phosphate cytidylyltransferase / 2-C-methyl-D-erythritol 2,4-cyclodiphosphate synthase